MRRGGELIYFFLAPFHNQLKRQSLEIYFKRGETQKERGTEITFFIERFLIIKLSNQQEDISDQIRN